MRALTFAVQHRGVDLVAMTAARALRGPLGLGSRLVELRRQEAKVLEIGGSASSASGSTPLTGTVGDWAAACTRVAPWFNPNKHRYALFEARPGALAAARQEGGWPDPWLLRLVSTDRPGPSGAPPSSPPLDGWLALPQRPGAYAVTMAVWDREEPERALPSGSWPSPQARVLPLVLWTLAVEARSPQEALQLAEEAAVTRSRERGLLVRPHVEGWTPLGDSRTLSA